MSRRIAAPEWPWKQAQYSGVDAVLSGTSTSAPFETSHAIDETWPEIAAYLRPKPPRETKTRGSGARETRARPRRRERARARAVSRCSHQQLAFRRARRETDARARRAHVAYE